MKIYILLLCIGLSYSSMIEIRNDIGNNIQVKNIKTYPTHGISSLLNSRTLFFIPEIGYQGYDYLSDQNGMTNMTIYTPCAIMPTLFSYIPSPSISISISGGYPSFDIILPHYRENVGYDIDLCDPIQGKSPCGTDMHISYSSAPTALFPGALNNYVYGSYSNGNPIWLISPKNCSHVNYKSNMTFSTLRSSCVNISYSGNTQVSYAGNLFVIMSQDGYPVQRWIYPFVFKLILSNTVLISSTAQLLVKVYPLSIASSSGLTIRIRTITATSDKYMRSIGYTSSLSLISVLPSFDAKAQIQTWEYTSTLAGGGCNWIDNTCSYSFSWICYPDLKLIFAQVSVIPLPSTSASSLNTSVTVKTYDDPGFKKEHIGSIWYSNTLYIAPILVMDLPHSLSVVDMWICYPSNPNTILAYNPDQGDFGCLQDFLVPKDNLMHPISEGNPINGSSWNISLYPMISVSGRVTTGISLELISPKIDITYYIHMNLKIGSLQRSILMTQGFDQTIMNGFSFQYRELSLLNILLCILLPIGIASIVYVITSAILRIIAKSMK